MDVGWSWCFIEVPLDGVCFFFFKQKTAYEMRISDWSSDVCSSDLVVQRDAVHLGEERPLELLGGDLQRAGHHGAHDLRHAPYEIGRASCRERVCQYV